MINTSKYWAVKGVLAVFLFTSSVALSEEKKKPVVQKIPTIEKYVTRHTGKFNGQTVKYTVTAADTHFKNNKGELASSIFTIAYVKDNVKNKSKRPITFLFNGGPGSASLWLHMGVFGPKRIDVPSDAVNAGAAPYRVINNPLSLLDVTDIVFIDPVGTGYSKVIGKGKGKDFWGVSEDAKSVGNFIREYVTKNNRWNSPKYIGGESYGTTRTAALVRELQSGYNAMALNGLILVSSILDFQTVDKGMSNDSPYIFFLPTYAATAWYHGKVEKNGTLEDFLNEVREFALNEYSVALIKGNKLPKAEEEKIIAKLSRYTGLSKSYLKNTRMRVNEFRFMKELLRTEGKTVGRLDSRFTGTEADDAGETYEADPSGYGISSAYTAAINQYMRKDLKVQKDYRYEVLSGKPGSKWNWKVGRRGGYTAVGPFIAKGMRQNKDLRVYVANGYYDMATPFFATEHTLSRYGIDPERVTMEYYESGHMMYIHHPSLNKLAKTVRQFILEGQK